MLTVGKLAKKFGFSRSALLYYHSIGLLTPSGRSEAGYRRYSPADIKRLEEICRYRKTGLSLQAIKALLSSDSPGTLSLLEQRLHALNREMQLLRGQQAVILKILKKRKLTKQSRLMTKKIWVQLLRSAGLNDAAMHKWHIEFERTSPEGHQDFLESLQISVKEVVRIRKWSRPW